MAAVPKHPIAAKVFMSASAPAPPDGSKPAIDITVNIFKNTLCGRFAPDHNIILGASQIHYCGFITQRRIAKDTQRKRGKEAPFLSLRLYVLWLIVFIFHSARFKNSGTRFVPLS